MMRAALLLPVLLLAACGGRPEPINANPQSISYKYEGDKLKDVTAKASAHCSGYNRGAKLRTIAPQGDQSVAIFDCVS